MGWLGLRAVGAAVAIGLMALAASPAAAEDIRVGLDQAAPLHLAGPAEGVAVGNPSIAGVSVQNDQMLFVTGRAYGTTNLVVVGANGRVIYSGRIIVGAEEGEGTVIVTRGLESSRMSCTPICRPSPDIGDAASTFSSVVGQIQTHAGAAGGD